MFTTFNKGCKPFGISLAVSHSNDIDVYNDPRYYHILLKALITHIIIIIEIHSDTHTQNGISL